MQSGHIEFLVNEAVAKQRLQNSATFAQKTLAERMRLLMPYKNTTLLINETTNLKIDDATAANHLKLIQINSSAHKDLFSSLEYGIWIISEDEKAHYKNLHKIGNKKSGFVFVS